ncbi:Hypothetical predicted protein [Lecanosticta acicola]|uniref:Uncharacterized protein n=1 Tax=Lecanosticta acicola TaxID=111012 RepID=A0AAI9EE73_9PEZI|nr:Hypothetical predicted protein [Lecanosticta acicola]
MACHDRYSIVSVSNLDSASKWDDFTQTLSKRLLNPAAGTIVVDYRPFAGEEEKMATSVVTTSISSNHSLPTKRGREGRSSGKLKAACMRVLDTLVHGLVPTHNRSSRPKECPPYQQLPASYSTAVIVQPRQDTAFDDGEFVFPLRRSSTIRDYPKGGHGAVETVGSHVRHDSGIELEECDSPDPPTLSKFHLLPDPREDFEEFDEAFSICSSIESLEADFEKHSRDSGAEMGEKLMVAQVVQLRRAARKSVYPQRSPSMPTRDAPQPPSGYF